MEGSPNPGRRDLPPSPSRSSSLVRWPTRRRGQCPGTLHAPASPTPLTGSEQLGWPPRKKKMPVGLARAAGQASSVASAAPKSPELGVSGASEGAPLVLWVQHPPLHQRVGRWALLCLSQTQNQNRSQTLAGGSAQKGSGAVMLPGSFQNTHGVPGAGLNAPLFHRTSSQPTPLISRSQHCPHLFDYETEA